MYKKIPAHIAIIMDGNRRWARSKGLKSFEGHKAGVDALREIVRHAGRIGIKYLTVYTFSTENMDRSKIEVKVIFSLLTKALKDELPELNKSKVKLKFVGEISELPLSLQREVKKTEDYLKNNKGLNFQVALNYGARREIIEAAKKGDIENNLYTKGIPDPDLIIRTGGTKRLSNFLLWQAAYSELYFTDVLWPDFKKSHLDKAILDYNRRDRRFGK